MSDLLAITSENHESEVIKSDRLVIMDFTAPWCGPCKKLGPILEDLSGDFSGKVKIVKVDVDQARELAVQYRVASVPTVVFMKDGTEVKRFLGLRSKSVIKSDIEQLLP